MAATSLSFSQKRKISQSVWLEREKEGRRESDGGRERPSPLFGWKE